MTITFAEQFHVGSALFLGLAQHRLLRVFVQFDVSAQRQPFVQLAMMDDQNLFAVNDKNRAGEIYFLVDMGRAAAAGYRLQVASPAIPLGLST